MGCITSNYIQCSRYQHCTCGCKGKVRQSQCDYLVHGRHFNKDGTAVLDATRWTSPTHLRKMC